MDEREFIELLQKRAKEQHQIIEELPFPRIFAIVTKWLSDHPWRYLIPLALFFTLALRSIFGWHFTEAILRLFY